MKFFNISIRYFLCVPVILLLVGCNNKSERNILYSVRDISQSHIAVLDESISNDDFFSLFPDAHPEYFNSSSEFLLSMAIGRCDAGIAEKKEAEYLMNNSHDYDYLSRDTSPEDSVTIIVHKRLLPGRHLNANSGNLIENSLERIDRNVISDNYWKLILSGLGVTVVIFVFGVIIAFILAISMIWMNHQKGLRWFSSPISHFIRMIHDVPSIVLIFFFYYVVFSAFHVNGIVVCIVALGVYSSGSFMNIINVHLNQVDPTQHHAAKMLGFKGWKKYRYIILPQAVKPMLPLLAAESKVLLRATSYAGYISQVDLVKVTEIIRNQTYDALVPLLLVSIIFLILSWLIVELLSVLYSKAFNYD